MPSLPPFACRRRWLAAGCCLSEKSQKRRSGPKPLHDGDKFRRKDLHDAVRALRKESPSPAGRPGNRRVGVRIFGVLDSLYDAAQCPAVRSESIWLGGACSVLRGREFDVLAQNESVLPAADGSALPAERMLGLSAPVLSAPAVPRALGRATGLCGSDGTAGSLPGWARGSLPLAREAGGTGAILSESLAIRPNSCRSSDGDKDRFADALARAAATFSHRPTLAAFASLLAGPLHGGTPFIPRGGQKKCGGGWRQRLGSASSLRSATLGYRRRRRSTGRKTRSPIVPGCFRPFKPDSGTRSAGELAPWAD